MWQPWIGHRYGQRRLLILGESFFDWRDKTTGALTKPSVDMPTEVAECAITNPAQPISRTVNKITQMICGCQKPTPEQSFEAWHSIAYTNYVPSSVGEGPTPRPTSAAWKQALAEWPQLLESTTPRVVIVLGYTMWRCMGPKIPMGSEKEAGGYRLNDGSITVAVCWAYPHPAARPSWTWQRYAEAIAMAEQKTPLLASDVGNWRSPMPLAR